MTPRMKTEPLYLALSTLLQHHWTLSKKYETGAPDMADHCMEEAQRLARDHLPSGSGFNQGTTLDPERCRTTKLMFLTAFQHMDAAGGYGGWTSHSVKVNPLFGASTSLSQAKTPVASMTTSARCSTPR
jgi:hypothetical protein